MGGCCCSSRKPQLHGTPVYYYCPPILEEHESLTSHDSAAMVLTAGFLVDLNLDTSTPDTYRPPPAPIPYDVVLGRSQSTDSESLSDTTNGSGYENMSSCADVKEPDCETDSDILLASPKKFEFRILKSGDLNVSAPEDEDVCPTCLEDYDAENPKIITKCNHRFHLSCILEWMERSDTCPICNQVCFMLWSFMALRSISLRTGITWRVMVVVNGWQKIAHGSVTSVLDRFIILQKLQTKKFWYDFTLGSDDFVDGSEEDKLRCLSDCLMEFEPEFRGSSSEISDQKNENGDYLYLDLEESDMDSMVGKLSNGNEVIGLVESDESRKCGEDCKNLYEGEECMISGSSVFSNRKRKRGCRWRMLDWVVEVAKNPCDPEVGLLPERPDWKHYGREQLWKQVLLARHALFLKRNGNRSPEQKISNWLSGAVVVEKEVLWGKDRDGDGGGGETAVKVMAVVSGRVVVVKKGECRRGSNMMKIWKDSGGWSAGGGVGEIVVVAAAVVVVATKQRMHPSMYDDHSGSERQRSSQRLVSAKESRSLSSKIRPRSDSSSSTQTQLEDYLDKDSETLSTNSIFTFLNDNQNRKRVPVGPFFQANVPEWTGETCESDSRWLGSRVWPVESGGPSKYIIERDRTGKGRQESCGCENPGSIECVRFHVSEKRVRVKLELGLAFQRLKFDRMGEEVALSWTKEEEKRFQEIIKSNPASLDMCFWDEIVKSFPSKKREDLVSYYFNVYLLRRRGYQNRSTPSNIESDDEESEFGPLTNRYRHDALKSPGSIFCSPKKPHSNVK
ncbi:hypothetical protein RHGRI_019064 [Rhododendron griersonianum]|uniref:RING-type domain-containing protein n=1 Tax=Rhododendron griersonianum TaxID=479676 RepID=A0AAV6JAY1_9ERIC|nr:hypothetical protein RHGRI_019064 [Rhododendron griersonianum]